jgi:hypothetical protein
VDQYAGFAKEIDQAECTCGPECLDADASKRAAAFAASTVSAVPLTIRFISLLSVFDLR